MKRSTLAIVLLAFALVASNAWWLVQAFDAGVTATYREVSFKDNEEALNQALSLIPVAAQINSTREQVIAAATGATKHKETFEKDGYTWIGKLGLKFGETGRVESVKSWNQ